MHAMLRSSTRTHTVNVRPASLGTSRRAGCGPVTQLTWFLISLVTADQLQALQQLGVASLAAWPVSQVDLGLLLQHMVSGRWRWCVYMRWRGGLCQRLWILAVRRPVMSRLPGG